MAANIRVVQKREDYGLTLDWLMTPQGTLDDGDELASAVIVAFGTDRLADADDELPSPTDTDRRGWWGDMEAREIWGGWPIGSRLWLLSRAKIAGEKAREGATVARVERYLREAMQPFVDARIATQVAIKVERVGRDGIAADITLFRGPRPAVELRFANLWDGIGA